MDAAVESIRSEQGLLVPGTRSDKWYREPWMWLVVGAPATVVVACMVTMYLAATRPDPVISQDYYREGLRYDPAKAQSEQAAWGAIGKTPAAKPAAADAKHAASAGSGSGR